MVLGRGTTPISDYLTSYSVVAAQSQLNQHQQASAQTQQMQQLQQQMLLQQQQLLMQQQEILRQQQLHQQHETDQAQVVQLFQQLFQQQKNVSELEMKLKEKEQEMLKTESKNVPPQGFSDADHTINVTKNGTEPPKAQLDTEKNEESDTDLEKTNRIPLKDNFVNVCTSGVASTQELLTVNVKKMFDDLTSQQLDAMVNSNNVKPMTDTAEKNGTPLKPPICSRDQSSSEQSNSSLVSGDISATSDNSTSNVALPQSQTTSLEEDEIKTSVKDKNVVDKGSANAENVQGNTLPNSPKVLEEKTPPEAKPSYGVLSDSGVKELDGDLKELEEANKEAERKKHLEEQIQKIKELQKQQPHHQQQQQPQQQQPYHYEPGKLPDYPSAQHCIDGNTTEDSKLPLQRQCGHYYPRAQFCSIEQDANNRSINEEEHLLRLGSAVEAFEAVVKSLSEKQGGAGPDGFAVQWKVSSGSIANIVYGS